MFLWRPRSGVDSAMSTTLLRIRRDYDPSIGPTVFLGVASATLAGTLPVLCEALFDTGSTQTVVSTRVVDDLELEQVGWQRIGRPGEAREDRKCYPVYEVDLIFRNDADEGYFPLRGLVAKLDPAGRHDVVIGSEFVSSGTLTVGKDWFTFEMSVGR